MRQLLIIIFLIINLNGFASHIVGGEMYYDCLGGGQYRITLKLYRDCFSDGAEFDDPLPITIFDGNNTNIGGFDISFPGSSNLDVNFNNNTCVTIPDDICIEESIYTKIVTLPASTTGYTLGYQRCCRGPNVTNLDTPENTGLTLTINIPTDAQAICNSSPRFTNYPPLLLCANENLIFDHSATEPDGDEIVYELCTPNQGGSDFNPAPNPVPSPPYNLVVWATGISSPNPFGTGTISINSTTGQLSASPETPGLYAVGICAKEYRNGILISTTTRDFLFRVVNCEIELAADITPQTDLTTFVSYCQGLTLDFENESFGGNSWHWDFGVDGINSDVSTAFEPNYTFPGPGTYSVELIVSQSAGCSDTTMQDFIINDELTAEFTPPASQCITDNSFDFLGEGTLPTGSTFSWNFGNTSTPALSSDQNPTGIVFSQSGYIPVTYTTSFETCSESVTENIFIYKVPTINFSIPDELKCAPYSAKFTNLSQAHTPIYSEWTFGDGSANSTETNPIHIYDAPGLYDVGLTIYTDAGCIDTLILITPNLIQIFPAPVSIFSVDQLIQDEYEAHFTFTDLSADDVVKQWFYFGNGSFTPFSPFTYTYPEPGVYQPYQIVENQYGCQDRTQKMITVVPVIPILVPNAFTPDGDIYNNTFKPVLYKPQQYEMFIYNRWGGLVYYSNDAYGEWDGNYNGKPSPDGVYVYRIVYNDYLYGLPQLVEGHVSLLR
jgi:gliding motility-associated-like protein